MGASETGSGSCPYDGRGLMPGLTPTFVFEYDVKTSSFIDVKVESNYYRKCANFTCDCVDCECAKGCWMGTAKTECEWPLDDCAVMGSTELRGVESQSH